MENIQLQSTENNQQAFILTVDGKQQGEMVMEVKGTTMMVYHTEVAPEAEGKGYAKKLLETMVAYARQHHLTVKPLCAFVHAMFNRHADEYADIWHK